MNEKNQIQLEILPIPDIQHVGLTTYDAKDPDTYYPLITTAAVGARVVAFYCSSMARRSAKAGSR